MRLFDILGPVMIGPSSSHTAGAARIGRVARRLLGEAVATADVGFYGSFASTWQGHGTDRAVAGGLMDMDVDDVRLRDSLKLARQAGMEIHFHPVELRDAHPNTVVIEATGVSGKRINVVAASVGGGRIRVVQMNGLDIRFTGEENTLIIRHQDAPGVVAEVSKLLAQASYNIATMRMSRSAVGGEAIMALEIDGVPDEEILTRLRQAPRVSDVTLLKKEN